MSSLSIRLISIAMSALLAEAAHAYPSFIGYGYTSCTTCHYNPLGNGPLTDYGRALGATTVAAKPFFADRIDDEKLAEASDFLGPLGDLPEWLRLALDYRGLHLATRLEGESATRFIHMQAEASATLIAPGNKLFASVTYGYAPTPQTAPQSVRGEISNWISREHYLAYQLQKPLTIYAGFMDPAFGIRVPDHNSYIRSRTQLNINDQTHGVLAHYIAKTWEASLHGMLGNLFQQSTFRQKGATGYFEADVLSKFRLGASALFSSNEFRSRQMGAVHARAGFGEGSSLLAQVTLIREAPNSQEPKTGDAIFLQSMTRVARGIYGLLTIEQYTENILGRATRAYRAGPSLQYFPAQRLELRFDLMGSHPIGQNSISPDTFTLQSQVHVWL